MVHPFDIKQEESELPQCPSLEHTHSEDALRSAYNELERRVNELSALNRITYILVSTFDLETMLSNVSRELLEIFQASSTGIALCNAEKTEMEIFADYAVRHDIPSTKGAKISLKDNPAACQMLENRQPVIISQSSQAALLSEAARQFILKRGIQNMMIIPLISCGEVIGSIGIHSDLPDRTFTAAEAALVQTIAGPIASAIENVRLFHTEQQQRRFSESLREVVAILNQSLDLNTVLHKILEQLQRVIHYDSASILLQDGNALVVYAGAGIARRTTGKHMSLSIDNPCSMVFNRRQPLVMSDVHHNSSWETSAEGNPVRGWIGVPLLIGETPLGILAADSFEVGTYHNEDAQILQTFANQAAIAIENARLFQREQQQRKIAESLHEISIVLNSSLDQEIILHKIFEQLQRVIQYDSASMFLREGNDLVLSEGRFINTSLLGQHLPLDSNAPAIKVIRQKHPYIIDDVQHEPSWKVWEEDSPIRSWIGAPIFIGEEVIGILAIDSYTPRAYREEDAEILQVFSHQAAISIHNARLYQDIRQQKRFFEILMVNSPVATVLTDLDNCITSWNPAAERLFGYTKTDVIGQRLNQLIVGESHYDEAAAFTKRIQQGLPIRAITQRRRKNGKLVDVELFALPVRLEGKIAAFLGLYHDITDLQHARQEAEAANRARNAFLASMSHELHTPLTAILGFSELLCHSPHLSANEQAQLHTIHRNGEQLLLLLNNLLDLARLEAGDIHIEEHTFNLHRLLDELHYLLSLRVGNLHVQLRFNQNPTLPQYICSDEIKLHQVLLNLLTDIIKFTNRGSVSLYADLKSPVLVDVSKGNEASLVFDVESCSEVAADAIEHLLPVSRQFIHLIGGEITMNSIPEVSEKPGEKRKGRIIMFTLEIPVKMAETGHEDSEVLFFQEPRIFQEQETIQSIEIFSSHELAALPSELLQELEYAAITSNMLHMELLLEEIHSCNPPLAVTLKRLTDNFDYASIISAIQEIKDTAGNT